MPNPKPGEGATFVPDPPSEVEKEPEQPKETNITDGDVGALLKRIEELEANKFFNNQPAAPNPNVAVKKVITRYSLTPSDWADPRERLYNEPKLQEHAFKQNFDLKWKVGRVKAEDDGQEYLAPRFELEVWRWMRDPETQELTDKQYRVHKLTFFEDPDSAIAMANEKGLDIPEEIEKDFLDEMRYILARDWLFEIFYPPKIKQAVGAREEVIGNRLVPVMEVSSVEAVQIPREKLEKI